MQSFCFRMRQSHFENAPGSSNFAVKKVVSTDFKFYLYLTSSVWTIWAKNWRKGNFQIDLTGQIVTKYISRVLTLCQFKSHERNNNYQKNKCVTLWSWYNFIRSCDQRSKNWATFCNDWASFYSKHQGLLNVVHFQVFKFSVKSEFAISINGVDQTVFRSWKWVLRWEREVARAQPKRPPSKKK